MPDTTYSDATPDANIAADVVRSDNDESQIVAAADQATPNVVDNQNSAIFLQPDAAQTTVDHDLVVNERQKQIDLVQNIYGVSGPDSSLQTAQTQLQESKNNGGTNASQVTNPY